VISVIFVVKRFLQGRAGQSPGRLVLHTRQSRDDVLLAKAGAAATVAAAASMADLARRIGYLGAEGARLRS
jgi:hypothetical protein